MFDVCIIGAGGVVGCAIARELAQRGLAVAAIEKHEGVCEETSGLNSRVVHSGFHEIPGTLKAKLAREGSRLMTSYARMHGIALLETGMLIAVPHDSIREGLWTEAGALWDLWQRGRQQHISFRFVFTSGGVRQIAPVRALAGIFIPSVCVIHIESLVESLLRDAKSAGAEFHFGSEVVAIHVVDSSYDVETSTNRFKARSLINSAGLQAHEISTMAGGPRYEVEFIRGDYYELAGGVARWGIRTLVYPAMPSRSRSKGIHFGPRTDGRLYIGPTANPVSQPAPKELFWKAARKFLPDVSADDVSPAYSGVRPKYGGDFLIRKDREVPPLINLIGIDSPGLSASMAIACHVAEIVLDNR